MKPKKSKADGLIASKADSFVASKTDALVAGADRQNSARKTADANSIKTGKNELILALDCCFEVASLAVYDTRKHGRTPICLKEKSDKTSRHSDIVFELLQKQLELCAIGLDDIDQLSVTVGPGRFSGIRIGLALMRALSLAKGKPLIGFSSLQVIAEKLTDIIAVKEQKFAAVIIYRARRDSVFLQIYDENFSALLPAITLYRTELVDYIKTNTKSYKTLHLLGEMAHDCYERMQADNFSTSQQLILYNQPIFPDAATLAIMTAAKNRPPYPTKPLYLRGAHITKARGAMSAKIIADRNSNES